MEGKQPQQQKPPNPPTGEPHSPNTLGLPSAETRNAIKLIRPLGRQRSHMSITTVTGGGRAGFAAGLGGHGGGMPGSPGVAKRSGAPPPKQRRFVRSRSAFIRPVR